MYSKLVDPVICNGFGNNIDILPEQYQHQPGPEIAVQKQGAGPSKSGARPQKSGASPQKSGASPKSRERDPKSRERDPQSRERDPKVGSETPKVGSEAPKVGSEPQKSGARPPKSGARPPQSGASPNGRDRATQAMSEAPNPISGPRRPPKQSREREAGALTRWVRIGELEIWGLAWDAWVCSHSHLLVYLFLCCYVLFAKLCV